MSESEVRALTRRVRSLEVAIRAISSGVQSAYTYLRDEAINNEAEEQEE